MVDFYLQAIMQHKIFSKGKAPPLAKDKFDFAVEKYVKDYINSMNLETEYSQNLFVTPAMKKAQITQELLEQLKASEENLFLSVAFNFIKENGDKYFNLETYQLILNELEKLDHLLENMDPNVNFPEDLQSFFNFDVNVAEKISKVAILLFQEENYQASLSLFILLSTFLPNNYEYWYRRGIAAQKCEQYDLALESYVHALQLKEDLIGAKLFSVECYFEKGLVEAAKLQLTEAKQLAQKSEVDEFWIAFIKELEDITGWR